MEALVAANRLQHEQWKHPLLKQAARSRMIGLLPAAFPAMKLPK
jgi:hypothetical protein